MDIGTRDRQSRPAPVRSAPRLLDATLALRQILNPVRRSAVAGLGRRRLNLVAVCPDGRGFTARLEGLRRTGPPWVWVNWQDGFETWVFPADPALPALRTLVERGYSALGHRLGKRATLLAPDGSHVLYLRPVPCAPLIFERVRAIHSALTRAGVAVARLGPADWELGALRAAYLAPGTALDGEAWAVLGATLARAHAVEPPPGLAPRDTGTALEAAVRQVGMAVHAGTAFTRWLERRFERWRLLGPAPRRPGVALVHGDLRLERAAWHTPPVLLDWEDAGIGDPEEDLGAIAAHLYWRSGPGAAAAFAALRRGYHDAGGAVAQLPFEYYARLCLVHVLAIKALSELDQARIRSGRSQWTEWPEVVAGW